MPRMDEVTRQVFSIQEKKVSTLIVAFLFFCGLGVYLAMTGDTRDLPPNLVTVLIALIGAIAGVNAVDRWASRTYTPPSNQQYQHYNSGGVTDEDHRSQPPI